MARRSARRHQGPADVAGVRTTYGSPIFRDHVPKASHPVVERIERKGGIVIAKSNTPEFGAGGSTFNEVFGRTHNPWNTALTSGGSTGGGAAALAAGEVWLAHGSDHAGSLRRPATYCSVVGLRPSAGRVTRGTSNNLFAPLSVQGPMARTVRMWRCFRCHDGLVRARPTHLRGATAVVRGGGRQSGGAQARRLHGDVRRQGAGRPGDGRSAPRPHSASRSLAPSSRRRPPISAASARRFWHCARSTSSSTGS